MLQIISLAIQYRHYLGYAFAVVAVLGALWYVKHTGYTQCERDKAMAVAEAFQRAYKNREAVDESVQKYSNPELDTELERRDWLRNEADI